MICGSTSGSTISKIRFYWKYRRGGAKNSDEKIEILKEELHILNDKITDLEKNQKYDVEDKDKLAKFLI